MKRFSIIAVLCALPVVSCKGKVAPSADGQLPSTAVGAAPFDGPVGALRGVVRITGDEPPVLPGADQIPVGKCFKAHERHRLLFRRAADGGVADVLVGVTDYKPAVPKPTTPVVVGMEDCSLTQRTVVLTMGQSIHVKNRGPAAGMPQLIGLPTPAVMAAVPGGDPVILTPHAPGRFELIDRSHPYANAEVFVVNYPTITVTNEQGQFEIGGIPAGEVKVNVLLPATGLTLEKRVVVEQGKTLDLTFDLRFELAKYQAAIELGKREEQGAANSAVPPVSPSVSGTAH